MKKVNLLIINWLSSLILISPASVFADKVGSNVLEGSFSIAGNIIPKAANEDDSGVVDEGAYMFRIAYEWAEPAVPGIAKSSTAYYAVAFFKGVDEAEDWVQSSEGVAAVYGNRYFLQSANHVGFGIGWYAGVATVSGEGVEFGIPYTEEEFQALAVAEAFYQIKLPMGEGVELSVLPTAVVAYDTDTAEVDFIPGIMLGLYF